MPAKQKPQKINTTPNETLDKALAYVSQLHRIGVVMKALGHGFVGGFAKDVNLQVDIPTRALAQKLRAGLGIQKPASATQILSWLVSYGAPEECKVSVSMLKN